ncbi:MAG: glycosyltransferase [Candidatus Methylomirabilis oxyfera]|nr:glycosyltransferase [Candidatus Methylomirabilis oxyfera]
MGANRSRVVMLTQDRTQIDRRILLQAESLTAAGYQVSVLGHPFLQDNQELPLGVKLTRVSAKASRPAALMSALRRSYRRLRTRALLKPALLLAQRIVESVQVHPDRPFTQLFFEPAAKLHADVYVAHDLPVLPAAIAAANSSGAKVVYDAHELYPDQEFAPLLRRYWREVERLHIRCASAVTTVNPAIAAELEARYGIARCLVLYNCLPRYPHLESKPRLFHETWKLPPSTRVVLYQGGLVPHRNLNGLVRAMAYVQNQKVIVVFLGDGPEQGRLAHLARRLGVSNRVYFHPAVPQSRLLRYTASADLGIIPYLATSKNTWLCTPNKLFEFLQAEVPILAHDLPELRRIIAGEGIGRVTTLSSPKALAEAIDEWFDAPGSGQAYQDALRKAKERYCWEHEAQQLLALYQNLEGGVG